MVKKDVRADLQAAGNEFRAARDALDAATARVQELMVAALQARVPQKEVIELSGYTRESVRVIARRNGIEAG